MKLSIIGGLGDELGATAAVRELRRQRPDEMVRLTGNWRPNVWLHNPYLGIGNRDDGRVVTCHSYAARTAETKTTRTEHYMMMFRLDMTRIQDGYPDLYFTREELLDPVRVYPSRVREGAPWAPIETLIPDPGRGLVAIDPGAGWPSRLWPAERFSDVSERLSALGYFVIQIGAKGQRPLKGIALNLVGRVPLRDMARFFGRIEFFVGNDSGFMHVAAAVGARHITVYGVTRFATAPYPSTTAVVPEKPCLEACFQLCQRKLPGIAGIDQCIYEISPDQVVEACRRAVLVPKPASRLVPAPTPAEVYAQIHPEFMPVERA